MSCVVANEVSHCMLLRIGVATCLNDSLIHLTGSVVVQSAGQADRWDKGRWGAGAGGGMLTPLSMGLAAKISNIAAAAHPLTAV